MKESSHGILFTTHQFYYTLLIVSSVETVSPRIPLRWYPFVLVVSPPPVLIRLPDQMIRKHNVMGIKLVLPNDKSDDSSDRDRQEDCVYLLSFPGSMRKLFLLLIYSWMRSSKGNKKCNRFCCHNRPVIIICFRSSTWHLSPRCRWKLYTSTSCPRMSISLMMWVVSRGPISCPQLAPCYLLEEGDGNCDVFQRNNIGDAKLFR